MGHGKSKGMGPVLCMVDTSSSCVMQQWVGAANSSKLFAIDSATEVELAAGCFAGKRAQFIRALLNDLHSFKVGNGLTGPIIFLIDNSAVGLKLRISECRKRQSISCAGNYIYDG